MRREHLHHFLSSRRREEEVGVMLRCDSFSHILLKVFGSVATGREISPGDRSSEKVGEVLGTKGTVDSLQENSLWQNSCWQESSRERGVACFYAA